MARRVKPPPDLGAAGRELWRGCLQRDESLRESNNPMRQVLLDACRTADLLDKLAEITSKEGIIVGNRVHPAATAWRKSTALLPQLLAALRMPDERTGKRPQRRGFRVQGASRHRR